jgi:hypothetical protein
MLDMARSRPSWGGHRRQGRHCRSRSVGSLNLEFSRLIDPEFNYRKVASTRPRGNRIQVWLRDRDQVERVNSIGHKIIRLLELNEEPAISFEFISHQGLLRDGSAVQSTTCSCYPLGNVPSNKFISINASSGYPPRLSKLGRSVSALAATTSSSNLLPTGVTPIGYARRVQTSDIPDTYSTWLARNGSIKSPVGVGDGDWQAAI